MDRIIQLGRTDDPSGESVERDTVFNLMAMARCRAGPRGCFLEELKRCDGDGSRVGVLWFGCSIKHYVLA